MVLQNLQLAFPHFCYFTPAGDLARPGIQATDSLESSPKEVSLSQLLRRRRWAPHNTRFLAREDIGFFLVERIAPALEQAAEKLQRPRAELRMP